MTDEELEKVARAATPGPWVTLENSETQEQTFLSVLDSSGDSWSPVLRDPYVMDEEDKAFIAAFNPATALALLERVRKAEARVKELEEETQRPVARDWASVD